MHSSDEPCELNFAKATVESDWALQPNISI